MALVTLRATANESPDTTQSGGAVAVTSPTNLGHAATTCSGVGVTQEKTCRWFSFPTLPAGTIVNGLSLKFDWIHAESGTGLGEFQIDYSLNNGGAWTVQIQRNTVGGSGSENIALLTSQNITQVQVRDQIIVINIGGQNRSVTGTVTDIRIEADVILPPAMPVFIS